MASRLWWGSPWLWLGVCAVSLVLGLVVWRGLFGFPFLFLPFVWVSRWPDHGRRGRAGRREGRGRAAGADDLPPPPD